MISILRKMFTQPDSVLGRSFNLTIMILILASLILFSVETIPDLAPSTIEFLGWAESITVAVFTAEYLGRLLFAPVRSRFFFSFFGLVDLLAILPYYLSFGVDLRTVRVLRVFRVFRIFKILRYTRAIEKFRLAFEEIRAELAIYLMTTGILIYLSSVGIYYFESETQPKTFGSIFHCLWWSIVTLTTVGYGDAYPVTVGGRVFTAVVLLAGIGTVAVPSGLFASALTKLRDEPDKAASPPK